MSFDDKVVLVTGGLSGIGRAVVTRLAADGARAVVFDAVDVSRDDEMSAADVVAKLPTPGLFVQGDVGEPDDVDKAFAAAVETFGRVDVLVNNAGITAFKPVSELTVDDFDRVMRTNVRGAFLCAKKAASLMQEQPSRGVIVNVASNFAFVGATDAVAYCTSKGAVVALTTALAVELGPSGIRVNALCPGATETEFNRSHRARPEIAAEWEAMTPLRAVGSGAFLATPAQIADAAAFLAGEASSFMTGSSLVVDGGWNAQ